MTEEENQSKPRILAVDDSRVMRRAMSKVLSKEYDVVEAENGEDAWTLLINDDSIQIVFSDLSMPFLDGYGLLERIRTSSDSRLSEIPVIIITGKEDDEEAKLEALDKGANDFITKPFDSVQLQTRAKTHISLKRTNTKLTETSNKLERQSTVDEITGLGGQRYFCKVGDEILSYANRHDGQFVIARIDIEEFNHYFILHGKKVMDSVLRIIGEKFSHLLRQEDTLARIGVSKFSIILKETHIDEALVLIERIRKEIQAISFKLSDTGEVIKLTLSAGLYEPEPNTKLSFKKLVEKTEIYLKQAIDAGGNKTTSFTANPTSKPNDDINISELINKLKENKTAELLPQVGSILQSITPLLKFLADNAREDFQALLKKISQK
ncbi:MAG: response regulator [Woeseiaceae bacterium]